MINRPPDNTSIATDLENSKQQVAQYDKLLRENMEAALPGIIHKILHIEVMQSEQLPDTIQHTKERKPDLLKKVTDKLGRTFILHLEYQVENLKSMVHRMLDYKAMLYRKHRLAVMQYVIYLGRSTPTMPTEIDIEDLKFRFKLVVLANVDYNLFLNAEHPEEQVFAMLANFNKESPQIALTQIIRKVHESSKDELAVDKYFKHLRILAQLRNFESITLEIMESLEKYFKIERDPLYIRGTAKGVAIGEHDKTIVIVKNLIAQFGFSDEQAANAAAVSVDFVTKIRASIKE